MTLDSFLRLLWISIEQFEHWIPVISGRRLLSEAFPSFLSTYSVIVFSLAYPVTMHGHMHMHDCYYLRKGQQEF